MLKHFFMELAPGMTEDCLSFRIRVNLHLISVSVARWFVDSVFLSRNIHFLQKHSVEAE